MTPLILHFKSDIITCPAPLGGGEISLRRVALNFCEVYFLPSDTQ